MDVVTHEEELSSPFYGRKQLVLGAVVWAGAMIVFAVSALRNDLAGASLTILLAFMVISLIALAFPIRRLLGEPYRVVLRNDTLRIYRGLGFQDVPLSRVKYVEHDLPGRGPRRVMLSIEPESPSDRVLQSVEFVPRGGELGLGGKDVADELRRRAQEARRVKSTTE